MPRRAREKSEYGIYHIMIRGINRQSLFEDDEDCERFVEILRQYKAECEYEIFAWCLMSNHVHLVMKFSQGNMEAAMKKVEVTYAYYFNKKYERIGHLVQDRFKSEVIEDDSYLYTVMRYVHNNPVKAGICGKPEEYRWSSYRQYLSDGKQTRRRSEFILTDTGLVLGMHGADEFVRFTNESNEDDCLEMNEPYGGYRKSDEEAKGIMFELTGCHNASEFQKLNFADRREAFVRMYDAKINVLQISRLTGIARTVIYKAIR